MELPLGLTIANLIALVGAVIAISMRYGKLEERVNLIWEFLMRRALSEALGKGFLTQNSPITVTEKARQVYTYLLPELRSFYVGKEKKSDAELFMEVEEKFGSRLATEVCPTVGLQVGACVMIAMHLMKEPLVKV